MCGKLSLFLGTLLVLRLSQEAASVREKQYWSLMPHFTKDSGETQIVHLPERIFRENGDKPSSRWTTYSGSSASAGADSSSASEFSSQEREREAESSSVVKRRKGPTLSVVNPLEILRQRLMLDLARRRIEENRNQIIANAELLENIGKRSVVNDNQLEGRRKKEKHPF